MTEIETANCYGVPRILRVAGCKHLCAFIVSGIATASLVPWIDIVALLDADADERAPVAVGGAAADGEA